MNCWELLSYIWPSYNALGNFKALELCVKSLKEGQNRVWYPSLRELSIKYVLVRRVIGAYFESRGKALGTFSSTS
jgi:hypothetical protein